MGLVRSTIKEKVARNRTGTTLGAHIDSQKLYFSGFFAESASYTSG